MRRPPHPTVPACAGSARTARAALALLLAAALACGKEGAPDTTSRIAGTVPPDRATNVSSTTAITVTFARAMDPSTITDQTFLVASQTSPITGAVTATATTGTFTPASQLLAQALYTVTLTAGIKDATGVPLPSPVSFSFTTGDPVDRTAPKVTIFDPPIGATLVPTSKIVTATFSKKLDPATVTTASFTLHQGTGSGAAVPAAVSLDASGKVASLAPLALLFADTRYTAVAGAAIADTLGIQIDRETSWSFTTAPAPDTTPPAVVQTVPQNNAAGVPTSARLEVVFSEPMNAPSLTTTNLKLKQGTSLVSGAVTLAQNRIAIFTPSAALTASKSYTLSVTTGVKDVAGNALGQQYDVAFTTGAAADAAAPSLVSRSPADAETGVATNRPALLVFSEPISPSTVDATSFAVTAGGAAVAGSFAFSGSTVAFVPAQPLPASSPIAVALAATVTDTSGNPLGAAAAWSFTTGAAPDNAAPTLASTSPADASSGAAVKAPITATFSEPVLPSTVDGSSFTLKDAGGAAVPGTVSVSGAIATFSPLAPLAFGAVYSAKLGAAITDLAGNHLAADASFSFTTQPVPAVRINEIAAKVASGAAGDTNGDDLTDSAADEFIEVLNADTHAVDVGGWIVRTGGSPTTLSSQFTFPSGTVLQPGARAVIFGGGTPTGDFGGAATFTTAGLSLTDAGGAVALQAALSGATPVYADPPVAYAAAPASGASWVRSPEGSGAFVDHTTLAGSPGVLWSPGVAAVDARPKLSKPKSVPAAGSAGFDPRQAIAVQFNMALLAASLTGNVQLFASDCATASPAVAGVVTAGGSGTTAVFTPAAVLGLSTKYCVKALSALRSDTHAGAAPAGATLGADLSYEFTTGSPDIVPPVVQVTAPADLTTGISTTAHVEVVFSKPMSAATLTPSNLKLKQGTSLVSGQVTLSQGRIALFKPDAPLSANKVYGVAVTTAVKDTSGNPLGAEVDFGFTTGGGADTAGPQLADKNPADAEALVAINRPVIAVFNEPIAPSSVDATSFAVTVAGAPLAGGFVFAGSTVAFVPTQPLPVNVTVNVALGTGLLDLSGNPLGAAATWSFGTSGGSDVTPPTLTTLSPADASSGVSVRAPIVATFSEFVLPSSVNAATVTLKDGTGAAVPGSVSVAGSVATFTPLAPFVYGAHYTGGLGTGITDAAGNHLASAVAFGFTAQPMPAVKINEIAAKVASGAAGDSNGDGATDSGQDEFVELINTETSASDISGWVLRSGPTASPGPCGALSDRFTFPGGSVLQPGARAVVFGGGAPAGDFGGALIFTASSLSLTDGGACVALHAAPGLDAEAPFAYAAAASNGASWARVPEGTGAFVVHTDATASGSAGVLWSPGVAPADARPKVNPSKSAPAADSSGFDPRSPLTVQLNMAVNATSLTGNVHLYSSDCATQSPEEGGTVAAGTGATGALTAVFSPSRTGGLLQATRHCLKVIGGAAGVQSDARSGANPVGARLAADVTYEFTTGTIAYNLTAAAMTAATSLSVTFSAAPNQAQAETAANYCIADGAAGSCSASAPAVTAAALTGSVVKLTLGSAATAGASYKVFATGVTRASDAAALSTASFAFTGGVQPPFNLASAAATGESELTLAFSDPPAAGAAAGNFCIADGAAADCSASTLAVSAVAAPAGSASTLVLTTGQQTKARAYKVFATGVTRLSDGATLTTASGAFKGFLLSNGSFEKDFQPAGASATAPPTGWTMVTSTAVGNLLHAVQSDGSNGVPQAPHGLNVARFDSLISSTGGREAQSDCFPVDATKNVSARYQTEIPSGQLVGGTRASVKLFWFKDATCTTASAVRAADTQTGASNAQPGVWEKRTFSVAVPPSDGLAAKISVRANYVTGASCGSGDCSHDVIFFDDLAVTQP